MWRWSWSLLERLHCSYVFSTYVEVILMSSSLFMTSFWYSPRMWRWSYSCKCCSNLRLVFSTYVEVIPGFSAFLASSKSILHVCGGDPISLATTLPIIRYSPRMWRWSQLTVKNFIDHLVFSTYVEVIPCYLVIYQVRRCILHVCGGDPYNLYKGDIIIRYSPRMWRWSR